MFHVDVDFTARERVLLRRAAVALDEQSGHHVWVRFVYDLDYHTEADRPPLDQWYLTRGNSIGVLYQTGSDAMFLGLTIPRLKQTLLVYDRLGSDAQFIHTAMHEFMHAFGVPHLPCDPEEGPEMCPMWARPFPPGRVMVDHASWDDGDSAPTCLNPPDADALAWVTHQPRADFRPCL